MDRGEPALVVGLGELLWDLLPSGPELGGAVSNFAVMSGQLGDRGVCASRLGNDELGVEARKCFSRLPVDPSFLQKDLCYPTGTVSVRLQDGQPEYEIHRPAAWDFLEFTADWRTLAGCAEAVCFGTLAQRDSVSRRAIGAFLAASSPDCVRVFDVNLRTPFFSAEIIEKSLECATVLKMNDREMPLILESLGLSCEVEQSPEHELVENARRLLGLFPLRLVCITLAEKGSLLVTPEEVHRHRGIPTRVVDAVGAGDAFTAAITHYYLQGAPLAVLNEAGNRWGSWVASQPGAMPHLDRATRESITTSILQVLM